MTVWECATLIGVAGAVGGLINTLMTEGKLRLPEYEAGVLCPGSVGNVLVGAFAALISWALYGAGAGIELVRESASAREVLSLTVGALAGAALVGVGGARWLNSEVDAKLLRASVNTNDNLTPKQRSVIASAPAIEVFRTVRDIAQSESSGGVQTTPAADA